MKIGNHMLRVLFDVDDTLIHLPLHSDKDEPNIPMIELLKALSAAGHEVYVSSGGGVEYAKNWCKKLGIEEYVFDYLPKIHTVIKQMKFDLSFDDMETDYAFLNCQVYRGTEPKKYPILGQ